MNDVFSAGKSSGRTISTVPPIMTRSERVATLGGSGSLSMMIDRRYGLPLITRTPTPSSSEALRHTANTIEPSRNMASTWLRPMFRFSTTLRECDDPLLESPVSLLRPSAGTVTHPRCPQPRTEAGRQMTPVTKAGCKKLTRLLNALRLNAPLFGARHQHRRVVSLRFGVRLRLQCCYGHGALFRRITSLVHFRRERPREQIWNAT